MESILERLCAEHARHFGITPQALAVLQEQPWLGNVRQLRSVLVSAVSSIDHDTIDVGDLALSAASGLDRPISLDLEVVEAWAIRQALRRTQGNVSRAAPILGIARDTLGLKIKKYQINKDELQG